METQGRSISSSILDFFRRPVEGRGYDAVNGSGSESLDHQFVAQLVKEDHISDMSEEQEDSVLKHQGTLVLADDEMPYQPPIVSILPVERLKLLRQKQEWRRRADSKLIRSLPYQSTLFTRDATLTEKNALDLLDKNESQFYCDSSNTPSPVKNGLQNLTAGHSKDPMHLRTLKNKKISETKRHGTKWSGDFEYDLAEYDNIPKHKNENSTMKLDDAGMNSPRVPIVKHTSAASSSLREASSFGLSNTERSLLLKGPDSLATMKKVANGVTSDNGVKKDYPMVLSSSAEQSNAKDMETKKNKLILPSVGFNFIKDSDHDTPSERTTYNAAIQTSETLKTKPLFSFTAPQKEKDNTDKTPVQFSTKSRLEKGEGHASEFNFDKKVHEVSHSEEEQSKRKKRTVSNNDEKSSFSFGGDSKKTQYKQPSFTFGNLQQESTAKPSTVTSFSFGKDSENVSKPFKMGDTIKEVVPDLTKAKNDQTESSESSLRLGVSAGKPLFFPNSGPAKDAKLDNEKEQEDKKSNTSTTAGEQANGLGTKITPSFSFGKGNEDSSVKSSFDFGSIGKANNEKNPSLTFSDKTVSKDNAKPTFDFGAVNTKENTTKSFTKFSAKEDENASSKPLLSFGSEGKGATATKPTFTFGQSFDQESKQSSVVGTSAIRKNNDTASKPAFSFTSASENLRGSNSPNASEDSAPKALVPLENSSSNKQSKRNFDFSSNQERSKAEDDTSSPSGFSFSRISGPPGTTEENSSAAQSKGIAPKIGFSFGNNKNFSNGLAASQPQPSTDSGFSFNSAGPPPNSGSAFGKVNTAAPSASFNFKPNPTGIKSQSPGISDVNPFIKASNTATTANGATTATGATAANNTGGFSFGATHTASNGSSSVFGNTQSLNAPLGSSTTPVPVPAFGQPTPSPGSISNPPSRSFTPSNTINLNFGNATAADPTSIFSGAAQTTAVMGGIAPAPQQIFGGTPAPPSQVFGGGSQQPNLAFNNAPPLFGNINNDTVQSQSGVQTPATNFQMPPGRKLARMRHSRRG